MLNSRVLSDFFLGIVEQICLNLVYTITPRTVSCDMSRNIHTQGPDSEEQLVAMLATLRVTATEEADFESRFLCEFHERVAREAVCCPARRHLFAHLLQMMDNLGQWVDVNFEKQNDKYITDIDCEILIPLILKLS